MIGYRSITRDFVNNRVTKLLWDWGIKIGNKPTMILSEAVYQHLKNHGMIYGQWCKQLLPEIAAQCRSTPGSVEVSIKRVIDYLWDGNSRAAKALQLQEKPKIKTFIVAMGEVVRR